MSTPENDPARIQAAKASQSPTQRSINYYNSIGYPQYAGHYAVPNLPSGAVVTGIREETTYRPTYTQGRESGEKAVSKQLILEVKQSPNAAASRAVPDNLEGLLGFGLSTEVWNPSTGKRYIQQGSDVGAAVSDVKAGNVANSKYYADLLPPGPGVQQDPFEQRLTAGMLNFQVVTAPVLAPKLIPFAAGGLGVGEAVKYVATGQHLTAEEAFAAVGIGELVGVGVMAGGSYINSKYVKPNVTESLTNDYISQQKLNENILSGKVAGETQVWKPSGFQQFQMKVTGAQPKSLAPGLSSFSSAQDAAFSFGMMEAESASFDMGFSPKSSFIGYNKGVTPPRAPVLPSKLPVFFGLGTDTFEQAYDGPSQTIWEKPEKGLPESQLAYDYRGPLGFRKPTAFEQIQAMKQPGGGRMKPLWDSIGSESTSLEPEAAKIATYGDGDSVALKTTQRASAVSFVGSSGQDLFQVEDQVLSYPQSGLNMPGFLEPKTISRQGQDLIQRSEVTSRTIPGLIDLQRAIVTPGYPSPSITKLIQPSLPWQNNLQRVVTVPGYSFVSVQRQSELSKAVSDQSLKLDLPAIEIPEVSQRTKQTQTMGWMIPTKSVSGFTSPGFKMEGGGYSESSLRRLLGLRSKKQKYPILSAKEVLTLTAGPSRRRRKR